MDSGETGCKYMTFSEFKENNLENSQLCRQMERIAHRLSAWYKEHRRDLPFRQTRDPYRIWVSEIILQQTRMEQGLEYYIRFVGRFPDVAVLARAAPDDVMKVWQGLGYYSRARNMQAAARKILEQYGGQFPSTYDGLLALPGIGPYTAAAIASVCFDEPTPVVDGNVIRFLARLYGMDLPTDSAAGKKAVHELAMGLIDSRHPGDSNQALIEFGALYCKPRNPDCPRCIFSRECVAFRTDRVGKLPVKSAKTAGTPRHFNYLVVRYRSRNAVFFFLKKREENDIWKGLYEFPLIETAGPVSVAKLVQSAEWKRLFKGTGAELTGTGKVVKHQLSHRVIHARFFEVNLQKPLKGDYVKVRLQDLEQFPVSRLMELYSLTTKARRHD